MALGIVIGALTILAVRFLTYAPESTHYHANFALYINGQREEFKDPSNYESIGQACDEHEEMTPLERTHMHDNINDVVHVHHNAVTWGQFFTNLGWVIDAKVIATPDQTLVPRDSSKITFILNDEVTDNISNRVIGDEDKLLVDYGSSSDLKKEYESVATTAHKYNQSKDPKSCGSQAAPRFSDRLKHLF